MPQSLDFESDQFLKLLTDALRSGPGSPQWRQAIQQLRARPGEGDEYAMLCAAREHLESGRAYREVRPGPEFTRKVMAGIEEEVGVRARGLPTANLIVVLSLAVLLAVVGGIAFLIYSVAGTGRDPDSALRGIYFVNTAVSTRFAGELPPQWRAIGPLPLDSRDGLRPGAAVEQPTHQGAGVVWSESIAADEPFALEVSLRVHKVSDDTIAQVFVTDQPDFSDDRATSPHELVWMIQFDQVGVVLPSGRVRSQRDAADPSPRPVVVRIMMDQHEAIIDSAGRRLWSGMHQLTPDRPRYVGVRFLHRGDEQDHIVIESIRVLKP